MNTNAEQITKALESTYSASKASRIFNQYCEALHISRGPVEWDAFLWEQAAAPCAGRLLLGSFVWNDTPQGFAYWSGIYFNLLDK